MAESGTDDNFGSFVPLELIETWKQDNVCFFCGKKSFKNKLKCEKCLEFEYCSIECLENNRAAHERQCNVISVRKGLRHWVPKAFFNSIISRAKPLDVSGEIKDENEARRELEAVKRLKSTLGKNLSEPIKNRKGKNRRNKRKKKNAKFADDKYLPIRHQQGSLPVYDLVSGQFGRSVKCGRRELSGQEFGRGWWKTGIKTAPSLVKPALSPKVVMNTIQVTDQDYTRMTSADLYPDTDEDTPGEVNGTPQRPSTKSRGIPHKTKGQCSRTTKKPAAEDNVEEPRFTKAKPPRSKTVKVDSTRSDGKVVEQCRNQTDGDAVTTSCCFCGKRDNALRNCMGCMKMKYCDNVCQSKDFKTHTIQCKRDQRFQQAATLAAMNTGVSLNPLTINFEQKKIGRAHQSVLLEIVQAHFTIFGYWVLTVDSVGRNIFLTVIIRSGTRFKTVNGQTAKIATVTLDTCLRPGNFILVCEPNCVAFINGTATFEITELEKFCFVLTGHP